jgi:hypothetical protein
LGRRLQPRGRIWGSSLACVGIITPNHESECQAAIFGGLTWVSGSILRVPCASSTRINAPENRTVASRLASWVVVFSTVVASGAHLWHVLAT